MSEKEPWVPEPPPEEDGYRDPNPPLCPECRVIVSLRRPGVGWCQTHGEVIPIYRNVS